MKKLMGMLLVFILVLTGCSGNKGTEVTFWNPFAGADGETFQAMVDGFNEANKGTYYINSQTTANDGNAYYDKIKTATQTADTPDLAIMHIDQMPTYANADVITNWGEEELANIGITEDMYSSSMVEASKYNDELYSIPIDMHPLVMWINQDLISVDEVPTSWDEVIKFTEKSNEDVYNLCLSSNPFVTSRVVYSALLQNNVEIASKDGLNALYNTAEAEGFLTKYQELAASGNTPEPGSDAGNMFMLGECASHFEGIWMKSAYEEAGLNVTAVPISTMFGNTPAMWASSHTFVKFNKEYEPEKMMAIEAFIAYVVENSATWAQTGQIPANKSVLESEEFKALEPQYSLSQSIDSFEFFPNVPTQEAIWLPMERISNEIYLGQKTPKEGLAEAEKEANEQAKELLK